MRLFEATGEIKKLGNELNADMINYIGSAFPVPTLTAESIANAEGDDGYCLFYAQSGFYRPLEACRTAQYFRFTDELYYQCGSRTWAD